MRHHTTIVTLAIAIVLISYGCNDKKSTSDSAPLAAPPAKSTEVQRSTSVPPSAQEVAHGTGELSYKADEDGAVYLTDQSIKRIVMRKNLNAGQTVKFDPATGQATIDGQVVFQIQRGGKHEYRLYFGKK